MCSLLTALSLSAVIFMGNFVDRVIIVLKCSLFFCFSKQALPGTKNGSIRLDQIRLQGLQRPYGNSLVWSLYKLSPGHFNGSISEDQQLLILMFSISFGCVCRYPADITLLRGNHESRQLTQLSFLPASIDGTVLCIHGGLSPDIQTSDQLKNSAFQQYTQCRECLHWGAVCWTIKVPAALSHGVIERNCEIPHEGPFCDLIRSDPEDIETWAVSPRGAGLLFGSRVTSEAKPNSWKGRGGKNRKEEAILLGG
ncbi:unnamed protein product [Dovyalis caffra]|uniref:Serine/threonine-protein phosphatase n=1 Tax=Dovyalis caffra TaxID=77055 RepID=A0AAV1QS87_9ROSI|nr:unnamed protein product [Dovyalis caffra]